MAKWRIPTMEQSQMAERIGLDPDGIVVSNVGEHTYVILELRSGTECYIGENAVIVTDRLGRVTESYIRKGDNRGYERV